MVLSTKLHLQVGAIRRFTLMLYSVLRARVVYHHVCFAVVAAGHQLSNLWKASASLHTLVAGGNYLGDRGLAALCGAFCYLDPARVVSLDVSKNGKFCRLLRVCFVCVCVSACIAHG